MRLMLIWGRIYTIAFKASPMNNLELYHTIIIELETDDALSDHTICKSYHDCFRAGFLRTLIIFILDSKDLSSFSLRLEIQCCVNSHALKYIIAGCHDH